MDLTESISFTLETIDWGHHFYRSSLKEARGAFHTSPHAIRALERWAVKRIRRLAAPAGVAVSLRVDYQRDISMNRTEYIVWGIYAVLPRDVYADGTVIRVPMTADKIRIAMPGPLTATDVA